MNMVVGTIAAMNITAATIHKPYCPSNVSWGTAEGVAVVEELAEGGAVIMVDVVVEVSAKLTCSSSVVDTMC
jgi:hypothetical protein